MRFHIIRNARIENVGKSQSCMVSNLRIIWKQTVPCPKEVSLKLQDQADDPDPGDIPMLPIHPSERAIDQASSARLAFDDAIALDFVASQRFRAQVTSSLCARDVNYYTHSYLRVRVHIIGHL